MNLQDAASVIGIVEEAIPLVEQLKGFTKIGIDAFASLGKSFATVASQLQKAKAAIPANSGEQLYRMIVPTDAKGEVHFLASGATYGDLRVAGKSGISERAQFVPATAGESAASGAESALSGIAFDPMTIMIAVTLISINKKLGEIQKTQQEISTFLQRKEKAKMRASLGTLERIYEEYKFNWNSDSFKNTREGQVQRITEETEARILVVREEIADILAKKQLLQSDHGVKNKLNHLKEKFQDYDVALYVIAYSLFLEALLLENDSEEYLNSVAEKVEAHVKQYQELYDQCYELLQQSSNKSIQAHLLNAVASTSTVLGRGIAKIPVVSRGQLDETLVEAGKKVADKNSQRAGQLLESFSTSVQQTVAPFIENIRTIHTIRNGYIEIVFDGESIYYRKKAA